MLSRPRPPRMAAGNRYRRRARFELIFASIWLAVGLIRAAGDDLHRRRRAARTVRRQRRARPILRRLFRRSRRAVGARVGDRARPADPDLAAAPGVCRRRPRLAGTASCNRIDPPRPGARPKKPVASSPASAPSDLRSRPRWDHDPRVGNVTSLTIQCDWGFPRTRARVILRLTRRKDPVDLVVIREARHMWFAKWFGGRNEVEDNDEPARFIAPPTRSDAAVRHDDRPREKDGKRQRLRSVQQRRVRETQRLGKGQQALTADARSSARLRPRAQFRSAFWGFPPCPCAHRGQ